METVRSDHKPEIRVICLDIDNTLLDFNACAQSAIEYLLAEKGIEFTGEDFEVFKSINEGLWNQIEKGIINLKDLRTIRFAKVFDALNIDLDPVAFEDAFRSRLNVTAIPVSRAEDALMELERLYPLYIATNGPYAQQCNRMKLAGFHEFIKGYFTSEQMHISKPAPAFFEQAFAGISKDFPDIRPDQILMIGDSLDADKKGAIDAGWQFAWYAPDKKDQGGQDWDEIVADLKNE